MKMMKKLMSALGLMAGIIAISACSSDSDGSNSGGKSLAAGSFSKTVEAESIGGDNGLFGLHASRYQMLYTPAELEGSGSIESVAFQFNADLAADAHCPNVVIKLGHTSQDVVTTTFSDNVETGKGSMITAFSEANITILSGSADEFFSLELDEPFSYNGVDNLVVEVIRDTACDNGVSSRLHVTADSQTLFNSLSATETTGAASTAKAHFKAVFAGGENSVLHAGGISNALMNSVKHTQLLQLSSEINGTGPVTGFGLVFGSAGGSNTAQAYTVSVKMGHTHLSELSEVFADNFDAGVPVQLGNNITFTMPDGLVSGQAVWIPLTKSFDYNGRDNLIIDIEVTATDLNKPFFQVSSVSGRLLSGELGSSTGTVNFLAFSTILRFNGAPIDVITDDDVGTDFMFNSGEASRQVLYRAAELGEGGSISKIACRMQSNTSIETEYANYLVTMGHTTRNVLDGTFANNFDDAAVVYDGNFTVPGGLVQGDWIEIPITPFNYDGIRNLTVQFASDGGGTAHHCYMSSEDAVAYPAQTMPSGSRTPSAGVPQDFKADIRLWINR